MSPPRIFGFEISPLTASEVADLVVERAPPGPGLGLIVTPNVQHVSVLHGNPRFRAAYERAAVIVCDGFPVHYYARLRGCPSPERVTGCDIAADIMGRTFFPENHRFLFVVDNEAAAQAVHRWGVEQGLTGRVATAVPEFGFEHDPVRSHALVEAIRDHGTTILFMGLGAPKSEIFVDTHRASLPPCWALCVGQAIKMALGLTPTPPKVIISLHLEWMWRIILEPRRMAGRFVRSVIGFIAAVIRDLAGSR